MKKFKHNIYGSLALSVLAIAIFFTSFAGSGQKAVPANAGQAISKYTGTYASAEVDTVTYSREAGLSGLSFAIQAQDSVNITSVVLRRVWNGIAEAVVSTDTLWQKDSAAITTAYYTRGATVTLAPIPDIFWVIVTYATDHGVINEGKTTPTVVYLFDKQFSK